MILLPLLPGMSEYADINFFVSMYYFFSDTKPIACNTSNSWCLDEALPCCKYKIATFSWKNKLWKWCCNPFMCSPTSSHTWPVSSLHQKKKESRGVLYAFFFPFSGASLFATQHTHAHTHTHTHTHTHAHTQAPRHHAYASHIYLLCVPEGVFVICVVHVSMICMLCLCVYAHA